VEPLAEPAAGRKQKAEGSERLEEVSSADLFCRSAAFPPLSGRAAGLQNRRATLAGEGSALKGFDHTWQIPA
jgi:hypothetical protein